MHKKAMEPFALKDIPMRSGSAVYNQRLSERRAIAVKTWLVNQGIAMARLQTKGFGESIPIAANTKPDGADNPNGRQKNRLVQVAIEK